MFQLSHQEESLIYWNKLRVTADPALCVCFLQVKVLGGALSLYPLLHPLCMSLLMRQMKNVFRFHFDMHEMFCKSNINNWSVLYFYFVALRSTNLFNNKILCSR